MLSGRELTTCTEKPTECGVSEYDKEASTMRKPWTTRGCCGGGVKADEVTSKFHKNLK